MTKAKIINDDRLYSKEITNPIFLPINPPIKPIMKRIIPDPQSEPFANVLMTNDNVFEKDKVADVADVTGGKI